MNRNFVWDNADVGSLKFRQKFLLGTGHSGENVSNYTLLFNYPKTQQHVS
jgi:hypothetical protein